MPSSLKMCPYCQSQDVGIFWREGEFWKCSACGLLFRNPLPSEEDLKRLYDTSWMDPEEQCSETGGTDARLARIYASNLAKDLGIRDFGKMRLIDFGAGRGEFSRALTEMGADVLCIEPFGREYLQTLGLRVYGSLTEVNPSEKFHGAVTIDVWEHLAKPWDLLASLHGLLHPKGWIFLATPNPKSLNARLFRGRWREAKKRGHIMFGEPRTITEMLGRTGFVRSHICRWLVQYSSNPLKMMVHSGLALTRLDGELRCIAWKP